MRDSVGKQFLEIDTNINATMIYGYSDGEFEEIECAGVLKQRRKDYSHLSQSMYFL